MKIRVSQSVPWEADIMEEYDTVDQALDWVESRHCSLDDIEILEVKHLDIYSLMKARKAE